MKDHWTLPTIFLITYFTINLHRHIKPRSCLFYQALVKLHLPPFVTTALTFCLFTSSTSLQDKWSEVLRIWPVCKSKHVLIAGNTPKLEIGSAMYTVDNVPCCQIRTRSLPHPYIGQGTEIVHQQDGQLISRTDLGIRNQSIHDLICVVYYCTLLAGIHTKT